MFAWVPTGRCGYFSQSKDELVKFIRDCKLLVGVSVKMHSMVSLHVSPVINYSPVC